jgi:hypothetical protein
VLDLEDLSGGISITDLTLSDFRMDITTKSDEIKTGLKKKPSGLMAVIELEDGLLAEGIEPGAIFLVKSTSSKIHVPESYPLAPHFLVYVSDSGQTMAHPTEPKLALDVLRRHSVDADEPAPVLMAAFQKATKSGTSMRHYKGLLDIAIAAVAGADSETRAASIFSPGATKVSNDAVGANDIEVVAWVAVLKPQTK